MIAETADLAELEYLAGLEAAHPGPYMLGGYTLAAEDADGPCTLSPECPFVNPRASLVDVYPDFLRAMPDPEYFPCAEVLVTTGDGIFDGAQPLSIDVKRYAAAVRAHGALHPPEPVAEEWVPLENFIDAFDYRPPMILCPDCDFMTETGWFCEHCGRCIYGMKPAKR